MGNKSVGNLGDSLCTVKGGGLNQMENGSQEGSYLFHENFVINTVIRKGVGCICFWIHNSHVYIKVWTV